MFLSTVPFLYSKRTAAARSPGSRYGRLNVLWPLRVNHSWNYPVAESETRAQAHMPAQYALQAPPSERHRQ